ncbi:MAG: DUF1638 domain-containing protein [Thermoguttaceae bacterium]|jgi:hypothetical protein|nr:DUF1638 domain-containing protein [Thermoguttaceae bacterium]
MHGFAPRLFLSLLSLPAVRLKLIACEILYRELCAAVARSVNQVDLEFLPKGLHDIGQAGMSARLAQAVSAVDESAYDAVLLGYALCSNGLVGLAARGIPLVVPRGHDCITLFLGSKERYLDYFQSHPGVYFKTSGWIERGENAQQNNPASIAQKSGMTQSYEDLVAKYGEDNARFLYEQLCNMTRNYSALAYIEMGIEPDDRFERHTRELAASRGWQYEKLQGDMSLLQALVDGRWDDERFLVVPPGHRVASSFDEKIIKAEPCPPS